MRAERGARPIGRGQLERFLFSRWTVDHGNADPPIRLFFIRRPRVIESEGSCHRDEKIERLSHEKPVLIERVSLLRLARKLVLPRIAPCNRSYGCGKSPGKQSPTPAG